MRRRALISLLGGAVAAWLAVGVRAQPSKTFRLGILVNTRNTALDELFKGLRDHGYIEGQNLIVEYRFSEGVGDRWPDLARELVALKVDAIVVQTTPAALAAKQATSTIPIVITSAIDPVGAGLANSLARPGGNVTGLALLQPEISAKALSLLKEVVPTLSRVAVLWNVANPAFTPVWRAVDATARSMGLVLLSQPVREPQDFATAFAVDCVTAARRISCPLRRPCSPKLAPDCRVYGSGTLRGGVHLEGVRRVRRPDVVWAKPYCRAAQSRRLRRPGPERPKPRRVAI
jgi:putative tryptophan/tyrosine transport system substrate-binding protein